MSPIDITLVLLAAFAAFTVSASAGLGGSLILVPALALVLGTKEGIALAALLLALNNVVKLCAYRRTIPWARSGVVVLMTIIGAAIGASLLAAASDRVVSVAVVTSIGLSLLIGERLASGTRVRRASAAPLAFASGATSGFSGTSGPLKGIAIRQLELDRFHMAGAASAVSLAGDATKTAVFADAQLLGSEAVTLALACTPLMIVATFTGRALNREVGERGYAVLFWVVMCGYSARLLLA